jgi:hypothetical protein
MTHKARPFEEFPMKRLTLVAAAVVLSACASYEPVRESDFAQVVSAGCTEEGSQTIVNAYVNKAYQNTVVIWDGSDPSTTLAANLPRPGWGARLRGVFGGEGKNEVAAEQLSQVGQQRLPVTFTLECQGKNLAPLVRNVSYTDQQGQRVAIAY